METANSFSAPQLEPRHNSDPYEVLGISPQATLDQVNDRYRNLAKIWHPDAKGGNLDAMKRLNEAYDAVCKDRKLGQS
ncbi:Chaperone protein DnaJ [subsurface metagenome]